MFVNETILIIIKFTKPLNKTIGQYFDEINMDNNPFYGFKFLVTQMTFYNFELLNRAHFARITHIHICI